ncbi:MAG: hypothetical protein P9M07_03250 [Candidatus Aceula meridiana]|nr:hypothetical protein [Candidatus Aceula meridiana]
MEHLWIASLILVLSFFVVIALPCIGVCVLGWKLARRIAFYPSKTPAIQLSILLKLTLLEIISFSLLLILYHILADYGQGA